MKRDISVLVAAVVLAAVIYLIIFLFGISGTTSESDKIEILSDGKSVGIYSLNVDNEIMVECDAGYNIITIKDGVAYISDTDCPNRQCISMRIEEKRGHMIICLPHRLIVKKTLSSNTDGVSQ